MISPWTHGSPLALLHRLRALDFILAGGVGGSAIGRIAAEQGKDMNTPRFLVIFLYNIKNDGSERLQNGCREDYGERLLELF